MSHHYRFRQTCPTCGKVIRSNWPRGATSTGERMLRHKIEKHGHKPTKAEKELLENV
jgi:ribosomal protein L32